MNVKINGRRALATGSSSGLGEGPSACWPRREPMLSCTAPTRSGPLWSLRRSGPWADGPLQQSVMCRPTKEGADSDARVVGDRIQRDMIVGGRERPGGCREQVVAIAYGVGATVSAFRGRRHGSCRGLSGFRHDGS